MNRYKYMVRAYARLLEESKRFPLGEGEAPPPRDFVGKAGKALFFAPHPDDECISGGLALRLMREAGVKLVNVAVTQGSKRERQADRWRELEKACKYLDFDLIATGPNGLEKINAKTREQDRQHWENCVRIIAGLLSAHSPKVIFFPHALDWNSTHIGTHLLVMDALKELGASFNCYLAETEFWGQMADPNLMVEISAEDLGDLVTATTFHIGEVQRNPYHLLLPAWMIDNVRRGTELVGGQGGTAPQFTFAALYRWRRWADGTPQPMWKGGKHLSCTDNLSSLFG
jgi:LmbE family N-acetylglucosaminyl deacetylase